MHFTYNLCWIDTNQAGFSYLIIPLLHFNVTQNSHKLSLGFNGEAWQSFAVSSFVASRASCFRARHQVSLFLSSRCPSSIPFSLSIPVNFFLLFTTLKKFGFFYVDVGKFFQHFICRHRHPLKYETGTDSFAGSVSEEIWPEANN